MGTRVDLTTTPPDRRRAVLDTALHQTRDPDQPLLSLRFSPKVWERERRMYNEIPGATNGVRLSTVEDALLVLQLMDSVFERLAQFGLEETYRQIVGEEPPSWWSRPEGPENLAVDFPPDQPPESA